MSTNTSNTILSQSINDGFLDDNIDIINDRQYEQEIYLRTQKRYSEQIYNVRIYR